MDRENPGAARRGGGTGRRTWHGYEKRFGSTQKIDSMVNADKGVTWREKYKRVVNYYFFLNIGGIILWPILSSFYNP